MRVVNVRAFVMAVGLVLAPSLAYAQASPRAVPDYDARAEAPADAQDVLLWIPRILTSPLYLVSEVFLRGPLGSLARFLEDNHTIQDVADFFTFGPNDAIMVLPTLFADFGFVPSVGLTARWRDFLGPGNRLSAQLTTFGPDWVSARGALYANVGSGLIVFAQGGYLRRPDMLLGGHLLDPPSTTNARYSIERGDVEVGYGMRPYARSSFGASAMVQTASFGDTTYGPDPSIVTVQRDTGATLPLGFAHGYVVTFARVHAALDTRLPLDAPAGGVRFGAYSDLAIAPTGLEGARWFRIGGDALLATDALGGRRVVSLGFDASAILPVGSSTIPFDQSIDLGGLGPMPGFLPGQVRGLSAMALTLGYEWPIWFLLHARIYAAVGNAFGHEFEGIAMDRMRLSFGIGFHTPELGDQPFEAGLGFGTDEIGHGASVTSVRAFLGLRRDL